MSLSLESHFRARLVVIFCGMIGAFVTFALLPHRLHDAGMGPTFFMPLLVFVGAYLLQQALSYVFPAECPSCGAASAVPVGKNMARYVCRACGAETNALESAMPGLVARARATPPPPPPVEEQKTASLRWGWLFLIPGIVAIGIAIWLADESIRLVFAGVPTEARVSRVTHDSNRHSKDHEISHTAFIEYKAGDKPLTLQRSWSTKGGTFWSWPNYAPGDHLKVIYLASDPSRASVHTLPELFLMPIFLSLFGLVFSAVGAAMIFRRLPEKAPDGTMVLGEETQPSNPLKFAIVVGVALVGICVFYYYSVIRPFVERETIARDEAIKQSAARAKAAAAARAIPAAPRPIAAAPVPARPGMSECQLLLLNQRNQYAEKNALIPMYFFNLRAPQGVDCQECRAQLASKLQSWVGVDVAARATDTSLYKPGCVAYRNDIYGTADGAKCIADFLGNGYRTDQSCAIDGLPYTITHRVQ